MSDDPICLRCGQPITTQFRFGHRTTGWEHMEGECPDPSQPATDYIERAAEVLERPQIGLVGARCIELARALADAGLLKSPEQQAVLDAAETWADGDRDHGARNFIDLAAAVDALRASQTPQESSS